MKGILITVIGFWTLCAGTLHFFPPGETSDSEPNSIQTASVQPLPGANDRMAEIRKSFSGPTGVGKLIMWAFVGLFGIAGIVLLTTAWRARTA